MSMSTFPERSLRSNWLPAGVLLGVGALIASRAGLDRVFDAVTGGMPWARVGLFLVLGVVGIYCAQRSGLQLAAHGLRHPLPLAFGIALFVALYVAFVDLVLFRHLLPATYVAYFSGATLTARLTYFMLRAFNENIFYRLFFMSTVVWVLGLVCRDSQGRLPNAAYWFAIILAQAVPMLINEAPFYPPHLTPVFLVYVVVRFILAGVLWGFLYWKYGFVTAETAHVSTHVFLQPIMGLVLGPG
ncbi:hypothetical protein [Paraburkholderia sp. BL21I4N1]|uniref:hypothetical protein n=1 Tax=Paraburkholderia sp. BL21I4N1 TaxID=1938801 RepID=UPI000D4CDD7D|nr:hypothetical protein [Paraburkholderia sp. BL21I4N1]PQV54671.1 hypothetical protein B0G83_101854 [Paraburkholderia sp. BL21I4N1]